MPGTMTMTPAPFADLRTLFLDAWQAQADDQSAALDVVDELFDNVKRLTNANNAANSRGGTARKAGKGSGNKENAINNTKSKNKAAGSKKAPLGAFSINDLMKTPNRTAKKKAQQQQQQQERAVLGASRMNNNRDPAAIVLFPESTQPAAASKKHVDVDGGKDGLGIVDRAMDVDVDERTADNDKAAAAAPAPASAQEKHLSATMAVTASQTAAAPAPAANGESDHAQEDAVMRDDKDGGDDAATQDDLPAGATTAVAFEKHDASSAAATREAEAEAGQVDEEAKNELSMIGEEAEEEGEVMMMMLVDKEPRRSSQKDDDEDDDECDVDVDDVDKDSKLGDLAGGGGGKKKNKVKLDASKEQEQPVGSSSAHALSQERTSALPPAQPTASSSIKQPTSTTASQQAASVPTSTAGTAPVTSATATMAAGPAPAAPSLTTTATASRGSMVGTLGGAGGRLHFVGLPSREKSFGLNALRASNAHHHQQQQQQGASSSRQSLWASEAQHAVESAAEQASVPSKRKSDTHDGAPASKAPKPSASSAAAATPANANAEDERSRKIAAMRRQVQSMSKKTSFGAGALGASLLSSSLSASSTTTTTMTAAKTAAASSHQQQQQVGAPPLTASNELASVPRSTAAAAPPPPVTLPGTGQLSRRTSVNELRQTFERRVDERPISPTRPTSPYGTRSSRIPGMTSPRAANGGAATAHQMALRSPPPPTVRATSPPPQAQPTNLPQRAASPRPNQRVNNEHAARSTTPSRSPPASPLRVDRVEHGVRNILQELAMNSPQVQQQQQPGTTKQAAHQKTNKAPNFAHHHTSPIAEQSDEEEDDDDDVEMFDAQEDEAGIRLVESSARNVPSLPSAPNRSTVEDEDEGTDGDDESDDVRVEGGRGVLANALDKPPAKANNMPGGFAAAEDSTVEDSQASLSSSQHATKLPVANGKGPMNPKVSQASSHSSSNSSSGHSGAFGAITSIFNRSTGASGSQQQAAAAKKGVKPELKSIQLAAAAAKREQQEKERKAALKEEREQRRMQVLQKKQEEERLRQEDERKARAVAEAERRKADAEAKAKLARIKAKAEEEAAKKRKLEDAKKAEAAPKNSKLASSTSSQYNNDTGKGKAVATGSTRVGGALTASTSALNKSTSSKAGGSSMIGHKFMSGAAGPSTSSSSSHTIQPSQLSLKPAVPQQQQRDNGKAPATEPEAHIELPDIDSEYSDSDPEEQARKAKTLPAWAQSPFLAKALRDQQHLNPDEIFGAMPQLEMEEIFRTRSSRFRARSSSANWAGADRLTQREELEYARRMGFR